MGDEDGFGIRIGGEPLENHLWIERLTSFDFNLHDVDGKRARDLDHAIAEIAHRECQQTLAWAERVDG